MIIHGDDVHFDWKHRSGRHKKNSKRGGAWGPGQG
jgi:hypothetical protein